MTQEKTERLISSIAQDICWAATKGRWKLPKHILVCMTMCHLYRSAELIKLMNRLGHSESYSFSLELDTAIAHALEQSTSLLSFVNANDTKPTLIHGDFDNFDQLLNDLTGRGSVHTANGIMLCEGARNDTVNLPSVLREKRSFQFKETTKDTREIFMSRCPSPAYQVLQRNDPLRMPAYHHGRRKMFLRFLLHIVSQQNHQQMPGWAGFYFTHRFKTSKSYKN